MFKNLKIRINKISKNFPDEEFNKLKDKTKNMIIEIIKEINGDK